ncbi:MAG: glycoside hydrolase family 31 protein [Planctomycetaceae bacterium]|nr:MAG: glycoside hydrolase family 31 protein [Planctomycetaceae bacterium]
MCNGFGKPIPIAQVRPLHSLLMTRASHEAQRETHPSIRPFVLCRSGSPGIQRYAQTWSGDNSTSWETLKYNIPMGLGFGLSGQPNTGHDVGGFWGSVPEPELLVRWVQNGIFHPRFSIHSWRLDGTATEPWTYPEVIDIIRDCIQFRYRLIPYLYQLFVEAAESGHPIVRPLVYHFPDDPEVVDQSFDFMLGSNLLIVSVHEPGCRTRDVYVPGEVKWCDFFTGIWYNGGSSNVIETPLERPTLLAREGAIIPTGKAMARVGAEPDDTRELFIFPGPDGSSNSERLVEDDGTTLDYRTGARSIVRVSVTATDTQIECTVTREANGFAIEYGHLTIALPPGESRTFVHHSAQELPPDVNGRRRFEIPIP